jgi:hypothetical protein
MKLTKTMGNHAASSKGMTLLEEKDRHRRPVHNPTRRRIIAVTIFLALMLAAVTLLITPAQAVQSWKWGQAGSNAPSPGSAIWSLAYDGSKLYAGCANGAVYQNTLGGGAWSQVGSNTPGSIVWSLACHGSKLYAGCDDGAVYENALDGGTWSKVGSNVSGQAIRALVYGGSKLYAGSASGPVYQNALGGGAWSTVGPGIPYSLYSLACDGSKLYAGLARGFVYENTLGGGAWSLCGANRAGTSDVYSLAYDGSKLYAGSADGTVYENALDDLFWTQSGSNTPGSSVNCLAYDGSKLYAGCANGTIYESARGGGAWSQSGSNTPGSGVCSLACVGSTLYAGCGNGTVYELDKAYDIDASVSGGHGNVDPVSQEVVAGDDATINVNASAGCHIASVTDDGVAVTPTPKTQYVITNATRSHEVVAAFAINTYKVSAAVSGGDGTVSPDSQDVNHGGSAVINIDPAIGYHTASITDNGTLVTPTPTSSYALNEVTANHTITATFASNSSTWYLAEGTTAWGFECWISIINPNKGAVTANITYMPSEGGNVTESLSLPSQSKTTIYPRDILGEKDFSTWVVCAEGKTIAVDRTMMWTGPGATTPEAHSSVGVTSPAKTWYLPEGSTAWGFECWLLIQNPNPSTASCTVTYMLEGGSTVVKTKDVPKNSRKTFNVADDIGAKDASIKVESALPVIPERAMYRNNRREGHDSIGTTTPAKSYYLAEGTTGYGFTTYVLVQNPNPAPNQVTVTYMTNTGAKPQAAFTMTPNSRKTIRVNDVAGMAGSDFSTQVSGTGNVIAERAMYWDNGTGEATHDSIGMDSPHTTFYLPDGQAGSDVETFTCVQNPNSSAVNITVSYLKPSGAPVSFNDSVPANSRRTFNMKDKGVSGQAGITVTCTSAGKKIMCERAMYFANRGAGTDTIGGFSD